MTEIINKPTSLGAGLHSTTTAKRRSSQIILKIKQTDFLITLGPQNLRGMACDVIEYDMNAGLHSTPRNDGIVRSY